MLLIVEGAFLARLPAEKIHALLRRSILIASALVILSLVALGTWHWMFVPVALLLPFIDRLYAKFRATLRQFDPSTGWNHLKQQLMLHRQQRAASAAAAARAKAQAAREREQQKNTQQRHVDMSRDQALSILGLSRGAGPQEIKDAHRRLMRITHPDRGGTSEQAAQVNRAKDILTSN